MAPKRLAPPLRLPRRDPDGHKGDYGRVLVIGGSRGMPGAVALASQSALRGGAGLVTFAAPEVVQLTIAGLCPCATSVPLTCGPDGQLTPAGVAEAMRAAAGCDVLAVGPGLGVGVAQGDLVRAALEQDRPVVLDADGLNNLCRIDGWPAARRCPLVLTPHPGEFSRLTGQGVREVQSSRQAAAVAAARAWRGDSGAPLALVLKGAGTVVTDGDNICVNATGNPGMATGGSGDVLTGLVAAFLAQGLSIWDAARLGVWCHGRAGDRGAKELGQVSLTAWDLLHHLPGAIQEASERSARR